MKPLSASVFLWGGALIALVALSALGVAWWSTSQPDYSHSLLQVRAPDGSWQLASASAAGGGVAYVSRDGASAGRAYVALFAMPADKGPEAMLAEVRREASQQAAFRGVEVLDARFTYSVSRGYPCVSHRQVVRVSAGQPLQHEQVLSCQHPARPSVGVAIGFARDGDRLDPAFEREAMAFADQVTMVGASSAMALAQ